MQTQPHNPIPLQFAGVPAGVGIERTPVAAAGESPDTNRLTQLTADRMRRAIVDAAAHPLIVEAVRGVLHTAGVDDPNHHQTIAYRIWEWIRATVAFRPDETVLAQELGLEGELELLITPPVLLSMATPAGDCDDFTMLAGAMLLAAGIPQVEVVTIAADPTDPSRWSHVYLTATLNTGSELIMDCSHGQWFGWEAPQYYARKTWGAITRAANPTPRTPTTATTTPHQKDSTPMHLTPRSNRPATPGTFPNPRRGGGGMGAFDWGALTQQITTGTIDIVKQVTQKPGQFIQTSGGVISSQVPGATPNPGGISIMTPAGNATAGAGAIGSGTLLVGALVIGAALLLGRR